jgi:hypothetical protein
MKLKITALAMLAGLPATHVAAQSVGTQFIAPNLSGLYRCVRSCAGPQVGRIVALGRQLVLAGPNGESIRAWIDWLSSTNLFFTRWPASARNVQGCGFEIDLLQAQVHRVGSS